MSSKTEQEIQFKGLAESHYAAEDKAKTTGLRLKVLYLAIILLASVAIALPIISASRAQGPPAQSNAKKEKLRNFDFPRKQIKGRRHHRVCTRKNQIAAAQIMGIVASLERSASLTSF